MTLVDLLRALAAADIDLWTEGDRLKYGAPPGAMTPALRGALTDHKPALLRLLPTPAGAILTQAVRGERTFSELGVEVELHVPGAGVVWLVARPTGRPRVELTPTDLTAIALVQAEFSGARVVSIRGPVRSATATVHEPAPPDTSLVESV